MTEEQIPLKAIPVVHALARCHGPVSFARLKEQTGLAQATLSRILNHLGEFGYAIKAGHGQYIAGPELVDMGLEITRNQIVPCFANLLSALKRKTRLNAELYVITPCGPVYMTHFSARGETTIPFQFGHLVRNRACHPAALFYAAIYEFRKPEGYRENFIIDRGGQWPELFRAAAMVPRSNYCIALSGMLSNVPEQRHAELKDALQTACAHMDFPGVIREQKGPAEE